MKGNGSKVMLHTENFRLKDLQDQSLSLMVEKLHYIIVENVSSLQILP